jgi:ABC-type Na+ efflux pump permease subunit
MTMSQIMLMFRKEWLNFVRGDRSIIVLFSVIVVVWGGMLATFNMAEPKSIAVWVASFSFVISVNFSSTVFILERLNGSLEILLTSGLSRKSIVYGKMLFVIVMTVVIGAACVGISFVVHPIVAQIQEVSSASYQLPYLLLYLCIAFLNTSSGAFFSVRLPNPRLYFFINLFLLGFIAGIYPSSAVALCARGADRCRRISFCFSCQA